MKLLIADDENLTRSGLISSIDWKSLGIEQILEADDGLKALEIAIAERPDIILSDIRMPRLTGIAMAERLESVLPDTSLIFMSGYSDKEYLKAAIKLKAINYVEKPLDLEEVKTAILDAGKQYHQKLKTRQNESLSSFENSAKIAFLLTRHYAEHEAEIQELLDELSIRLKSGYTFTTYIVKTQLTDINTLALKELKKEFDVFLHHYHLSSFYIQMHAVYHVFHILGESVPSSTAFTAIESFLTRKFSSYGHFYIVRGSSVNGISRVYSAYNDAVTTLQSSFFFAPDTILTSDIKLENSSIRNSLDYESFLRQFSEALLNKDQPACMHLLKDIFAIYHQNVTVLSNQVKDIYYKLFMIFNDCCQKLKLSIPDESVSSRQSILACIEVCFSFYDLHQTLVDKIEAFFASIARYIPEDSTIFLIKDYISKHYAEENLSIKEISEHVFLSVSYACTYFKAQTGQTLNQYLTDFRMQKAMQLLADARYQIADISSQVGYSNGNYFSKSFKKFTGLSPSKYREKVLK